MIEEKKRILALMWLMVVMFSVSLVVFKLGNNIYNANNNLELADTAGIANCKKQVFSCPSGSKAYNDECHTFTLVSEPICMQSNGTYSNGTCYFSDTRDKILKCTECQKGFTLVNGQCVSVCSAGWWRGQNSCEKCPKGYSCSGAGGKTLCESGYYQDEEGKSTCKKCPQGQLSRGDRTGCYTPVSGNTEACYKDSNNNYYYGNYNNQSGYTKLSNSKETCNNLKIIKVDENGNTINGATIEFEDKNVTTNQITPYMIGEENINSLKSGLYEIRETSAPANYMLDNSTISVNVNSDGIISVTGNIDLGVTNNTRNVIIKIKNNPIPVEKDKCYVLPNNVYCYGKEADCGTNYLKIIDSKDKCNTIKVTKVDEQNNKINGAVFVLENAKGTEINNFSIGEANINELAEGSYILKETFAPVNYELDASDIRITVSSDGNVIVTGSNNITVSENNTRGVSVTIRNSLKEVKDDKKNCYVNYGIGKENTYCYGKEEECKDFGELLEGKDEDSCKENDMCYRKTDGTYVVGKYSNQNGYIPSGDVCPACYKNTKGEYRWTNNPTSDEEKDSSITVESMCVTKTTSSTSSSSTLKIILIILIIVVLVFLLLFKSKKTKNDEGMSTEE